jgi:hypothetical protein
MTPEGTFKLKLIRELEQLYPGAVILKNDANRHQGIPDHLILYGPHWAAFEAKASSRASHRPNQDYFIDLLNEMSFASFVYPQNKEKFLDELQQALRPGRRARVPIGF